MKGFLIAGGSIPGTDHIKPGQPVWINNHDAFAWSETDDALVAVVCDGCGSTPHPEVGSQIASRLIARRLGQILAMSEGTLWKPENIPAMLESFVRPEIIGDIKQVSMVMNGGEFDQKIVEDNFFFTIVAAAMTKDWTALFTFGDGVVSLNSETIRIRPPAGNAPPYIGQVLVPGRMPEQFLHFVIHHIIPTESVSSILLGTDGMGDFMDAAHELLPGRSEPLGPIQQFWTDDRFVTNSDFIRRRLALANVEKVDASEEHPRIMKGLLHDDTTAIVIKRTKGE